MKNHRALLGMSAAALLATRPTALAGSLKNEASAAEMISQMKSAIETHQTQNKKEWAELQNTWKAFHDELKNSTRDVVTQNKLDAMNASIQARIDELKASTGAISKLDKSMEDLGAEMDKMNSKIAALSLGAGPGGKPVSAEMQAYAKAFNTFFRKGEDAPGVGGKYALSELEVKAALTANSNPDGGFTVTPEIDSAIDEVLKEVSPMRRLANVIRVGTNEYKKLVNQHGTASGWVGETESRPSTLASQLSEVKFPVFEIYAMPAASQGLLDDSSIDIAAWISSEVELEFAFQEGLAFTSGNGVNRPRGILGYNNVADSSYSWGNVGFIASGASGAFVAAPNGDRVLIDTYFALKSAYRRNATWLMNRKTQGEVRKLKSSDGDPLIQMSLMRDGMVELMLGRPVEEMPDMPDIGANTFSIAIGDFRRAYNVIDRQGTRVLRDPYSAKPYVLFYTTKRVGGGIANFEALKLIRFST
jgi:HK97 family phage major capsid protein